GNSEILRGLLKVKTNIDSGVFEAIQEAAIAALRGSDEVIEKNCKIFAERRDVLVKGLKEAGFEVKKPKGTFYVWCKVGMNSVEFVKMMLNKTGVLCTPGIGFGEYGEGYVRFALTKSVSEVEEAIKRIKEFAKTLSR
ncbi:MAG: aminotransferase class I/II-fold pyridoxal phosphate-dependent enzyme, partial [Archaeoglobaceae archaeon]